MVKQAKTYSVNFLSGGFTLPKNALYLRQNGDEKGQAPRVVYLLDPRKAMPGQEAFTLFALDLSSGRRYTIPARAGSGIGRQFAQFVAGMIRQGLPVPRPDYGCSRKEALACGAPRDARPAAFDCRRAKPEPAHRMTDKDAVEGVRKGPRWYSVEGYWATL